MRIHSFFLFLEKLFTVKIVSFHGPFFFLALEKEFTVFTDSSSYSFFFHSFLLIPTGDWIVWWLAGWFVGAVYLFSTNQCDVVGDQ